MAVGQQYCCTLLPYINVKLVMLSLFVGSNQVLTKATTWYLKH